MSVHSFWASDPSQGTQVLSWLDLFSTTLARNSKGINGRSQEKHTRTAGSISCIYLTSLLRKMAFSWKTQCVMMMPSLCALRSCSPGSTEHDSFCSPGNADQHCRRQKLSCVPSIGLLQWSGLCASCLSVDLCKHRLWWCSLWSAWLENSWHRVVLAKSSVCRLCLTLRSLVQVSPDIGLEIGTLTVQKNNESGV